MGHRNLMEMSMLEEFFLARFDNKYDNTTAIGAVKGKGKSTFEIQLLRDIDSNFDLERNIAYRRAEITEKAYKLPLRSGLGFDEGGRAAYSRNWNTREQKDLIVKLWQIRHRKLLMPVCIQNFFKLDSDLRDMIDIWVQIPARGLAMIYMKDENPYAMSGKGDPWHVADNLKIINRFYKGPKDGVSKLVKGLRRCVGYMGEVRFKPLPPRLEEQFNIISTARKETGDDTEEDKTDKWQERTILMLKALREQGKSYTEISNMCGINKAYISNLVNGKDNGKPLQPKVVVENNKEQYISNNLSLDSVETKKDE